MCIPFIDFCYTKYIDFKARRLFDRVHEHSIKGSLHEQ